jgi:polyhydroxybutyrate depolymerase
MRRHTVLRSALVASLSITPACLEPAPDGVASDVDDADDDGIDDDDDDHIDDIDDLDDLDDLDDDDDDHIDDIDDIDDLDDLDDLDDDDLPDEQPDPPPSPPPDAPPERGPVRSDGCGGEPATSGSRALRHGGRDRSYLLHVPAGAVAGAPLPVVVNLHGRTITAEVHEGLTDFSATADVEGFILITPQGVGRTWNGGACCGEAMEQNIDDVSFIAAVLDDVEGALCVDSARVFVAGMSNGGYMTYRLACELAERFAGAASVAGPTAVTCDAPARPVPVFHLHGTSDNIVPYNGFGGAMSVEGTTADWVERNSASQTAEVTFDEDDVSCRRWAAVDADSAEVRLCRIDGGGHQWPGGGTIPGLGRNTDTINATEAIWAFFAAQPSRPGG